MNILQNIEYKNKMYKNIAPIIFIISCKINEYKKKRYGLNVLLDNKK